MKKKIAVKLQFIETCRQVYAALHNCIVPILSADYLFFSEEKHIPFPFPFEGVNVVNGKP